MKRRKNYQAAHSYQRQCENRQKRQANIDFITLAEQEMALMRGRRRPKTVHNCRTALRALLRYLNDNRPDLGGRLPLGSLTAAMMADFKAWHLRRGLRENTAREYLRSLRSLVNRCMAKGAALRPDIFSGLSTSAMPGCRASLSERDMRRLSAVRLEPGSTDELVRDCALFSYLTGGMPFADMARLTDGNYDPSTNQLTYRRHKTGVSVRLRLPPKARAIWQRHASGGPFHFALIRGGGPDGAERECANGLAVYNRRLRRIAAYCGVKARTTSYVVRHTFATVARNHYHAAVGVISVPLGHRSERTTAIYLSQPDMAVVAALLRKLDRGLL